MKNTTTIRTTLVLAAALGLMSSTMAFAQQGRSTQGLPDRPTSGTASSRIRSTCAGEPVTGRRRSPTATATSICSRGTCACFPPAPKPAAAPPPPPPPPRSRETHPHEDAGRIVDRAVRFRQGRADGQREAQLDKEVVARLGEFSSLRLIHVEGHTDRIGTQEYNQKLSERRADAVKAYLVSKGVDTTKDRDDRHGQDAAGEVVPRSQPRKARSRTSSSSSSASRRIAARSLTVSGTGR